MRLSFRRDWVAGSSHLTKRECRSTGSAITPGPAIVRQAPSLDTHARTGRIPHARLRGSRRAQRSMAAVPQPHENWKEMLLAGNVQHATSNASPNSRDLASRDEHSTSARPSSGTTASSEAFGSSRTSSTPRDNFPPPPRSSSSSAGRRLDQGDTRPRRLQSQERSVRPRRQLVLVDHGVALLGDPAFDLGFSFAHLREGAPSAGLAREASSCCADTGRNTSRIAPVLRGTPAS